MTTPTITESRSPGSVGERVELARYRTSTHERILYGQRIDGHHVRFLGTTGDVFVSWSSRSEDSTCCAREGS